jgi:hypothetical protein
MICEYPPGKHLFRGLEWILQQGKKYFSCIIEVLF